MSRRDRLHPTSKRVYRFIVEYHQLHGYMPALEDIKRGIGMNSQHGLLKHLKRLEKFGWIERDFSINRGMRFQSPRDPDYIRVREGDRNLIEVHRSLLKNDQRDILAVRFPLGMAVVSLAPPRDGDLVLVGESLGNLHGSTFYPLGKPPVPIDPQDCKRVVLLLSDLQIAAQAL